MFLPFVKGFTLGASLIIAIGSQNAFVLRQGLRREYVFVICTICFFCDAVLIFIGAGGFGTLVASSETFLQVARWGGAFFLFIYGLRSFRSAFKAEVLNVEQDQRLVSGLTWAISTTLALTLLNPHVYLDTIVLLGSIAGQFPGEERLAFTVGAVCASMLWFYGLGYGARILTPLFQKPVSWKVLDVLIGVIMWSIAISLVNVSLKA